VVPGLGGGNYEAGSLTDPVGPSQGLFRVLRGGSWDYLAGYCRSAYRDVTLLGYRGLGLIGFRVMVGAKTR
jgi:formylglycine-generating enzyme required for sulfatase activity